MSREAAITKTFDITRPGQVVHFELRIPRAAESVIGVELGHRWVSGSLPQFEATGGLLGLFTPTADFLLGEISLQSFDKAATFYSGELRVENEFNDGDISRQFYPLPKYIGQPKRLEDVVWLDNAATLIKGAYRDKLQEAFPGAYSYRVRVYLWMQRKDSEK